MDFFNSKTFNALEARLNSLQIQADVHAQNIANIDTPGYKAKTATFEEVLGKAKASYRVRIETDDATSVRPDGNNVDYEAESTELFKTYLQYSYISQKLTGSINNIRTVLEGAPR